MDVRIRDFTKRRKSKLKALTINMIVATFFVYCQSYYLLSATDADKNNNKNATTIRQGTKTASGIVYLSAFSVV